MGGGTFVFFISGLGPDGSAKSQWILNELWKQSGALWSGALKHRPSSTHTYTYIHISYIYDNIYDIYLCSLTFSPRQRPEVGCSPRKSRPLD